MLCWALACTLWGFVSHDHFFIEIFELYTAVQPLLILVFLHFLYLCLPTIKYLSHLRDFFSFPQVVSKQNPIRGSKFVHNIYKKNSKPLLISITNEMHKLVYVCYAKESHATQPRLCSLFIDKYRKLQSIKLSSLFLWTNETFSSSCSHELSEWFWLMIS